MSEEHSPDALCATESHEQGQAGTHGPQATERPSESRIRQLATIEDSDRLSEQIARSLNHLAAIADSVPLSDVALHLDNAGRGFVAELTDWTEPKRKESA